MVFTFCACNNNVTDTSVNSPSITNLSGTFSNFEELKKASNVIVEGEVTNEQNCYIIGVTTYISTKVKISRVFKSDVLPEVKKDEFINILL